MSKGSGRRPREIDLRTFEKNWENIFGRNNRNDKPAQGDRLHNEECTTVRDSEGIQDRSGEPAEDSKVNADERGKRKRSGKGSLRIQP